MLQVSLHIRWKSFHGLQSDQVHPGTGPCHEMPDPLEQTPEIGQQVHQVASSDFCSGIMAQGAGDRCFHSWAPEIYRE
jgi:hypothetical protein